MALFPPSVERLIKELAKLPGIGQKSAQRLAFFLLSLPREEAQKLAQAITEVKEKIFYCALCYNLTEIDPCPICSDPARDRHLLCILEKPSDMLSIERGGAYKGLYYILHGLISPLKNRGPETLKLEELLNRLKEGTIQEVILATSMTTEGEHTALYLHQLLKPFQVKVSRIAYGLPMGSSLEYADEITLSKSLEGRREL